MIERERRGELEIVRLARPPVNALDVELSRAIETAFAELAASDARAVVLTGAGRCFSAGVDLFRLVREGPDYARAIVPAFEACFQRLFAFEKPVVAAVNGHAIAGGCILALACDERVCVSEQAKIGVPELLVGVTWPVLALEIVRFALPDLRGQELVNSGRTVEPGEAQALGMVEELADPVDLLDSALRRAQRLAAIPAGAFRMAKLQMRAAALERVERGNRAHAGAIVEAWARPETLDAVRAYLERTVGKSRRP
jgi:enoyl-CoA hydratase